MIRGLATGELCFRDIGRVLLKEAAVGLLLGASLAVLTPGRAMLLPPRIPLHEALPVGAAMFSVVIVATLVGVLAPMLITRPRLDPAVMAGPLMATLINVSDLTIYLQTARLLLRPG